jgi:plastocyanin
MSSTTQQFVNRLLAVLGVALVVATGVVLVVHEGQSADATPAAGAAKSVDTIDIKDFLYDPEATTVAVGTKITFTNRDSAPHTATSGASPKADGVFDTGTLTKGQRKSVKVTKAGTFAYYCAIHPFMKATVIVR